MIYPYMTNVYDMHVYIGIMMYTFVFGRSGYVDNCNCGLSSYSYCTVGGGGGVYGLCRPPLTMNGCCVVSRSSDLLISSPPLTLDANFLTSTDE